MTDTKLNFEMSASALDDGDLLETRFLLYHVEFLKSWLLVAEAEYVFDHKLSREELVRFFRGFAEVRDERYDARVKQIRPVSLVEIQKKRGELRKKGVFKMTEATAEAQVGKDLDALAKEEIAKKKWRNRQR
jgi:hypothetical protein